jgi:hypothetical protein
MRADIGLVCCRVSCISTSASREIRRGQGWAGRDSSCRSRVDGVVSLDARDQSQRAGLDGSSKTRGTPIEIGPDFRAMLAAHRRVARLAVRLRAVAKRNARLCARRRTEGAAFHRRAAAAREDAAGWR